MGAELSISTLLVSVSAELQAMADTSPDQSPHRTDEPYRRALITVYARLAATARKLGVQNILRQEVGPQEPYDDAAGFIADLDVIADSLRANHGLPLTRPRLDTLRRGADIFGFHLATLDMRQSSDVHERVLSELFRAAGVVADYAALNEEEKRILLLAELAQPRLLYSPYLNYSYETNSELSVIRMAKTVREQFGQRAIRNYIISHTETVSDLLEVFLLQKETGLLRIGDAVSAGSSMMPQKKNPDIFELVRGKSALGLANVVHLFTLVKGLPGGYNRDLQDDRRAALQSGDTVLGALRAVRLATPHLEFDRAACLRAVSDGSTQATDLAEALVQKGMPFREAYRAVGALVRRARDEGKTLAELDLAAAQAAHPEFDAECIKRLDPASAAAAKHSVGGTAPERVAEQLAELAAHAKQFAQAANAVPDLQHIAETIAKEPL